MRLTIGICDESASVGLFLLSPLRFRGASFFIRCLFTLPLVFYGASFFVGGLFTQPHAF
jgi:hypothetical protein